MALYGVYSRPAAELPSRLKRPTLRRRAQTALLRVGFLGRGIAAFLGLCFAATAWAAAPQFLAQRVTGPIAMDGKLDDPAWRKARVVTACFEAYPHARTRCRYPTEVRVLYDDQYLYVGLQADDPKPGLIRAHFERRDRLFSPNSDDVLLLYLDALGTGRSAQMFAVNPRNNQLDGFWREADQSEDYTSDFDWTAVAARSPSGWTVEMRIPFSSLRYRPGRRQVWKLIVWRNVIRGDFHQEASTEIPSGANCLMCYAGDLVLNDFPSDAAGHRLSLTPEITLTHDTDGGDYGSGSHNHLNLGGYLSWQPRAGMVVDGMWNPDFSQVEADSFQPTANNQFALLYPEKRPFFLESKNLLATPLNVIYTRSITEPRWGARVTQQMNGGNYTALASEDRGGGSVIEPGELSSTLVPQPGSSLASLGRFQYYGGDWRLGGLFTWRGYSGGAHNLVAGPDFLWIPTKSDRLRMQFLYSATRNPDRPDLYPTWTGQSFDDYAAYVDWSHGTARWWWQTTYERLGDDFRAWDGFIPQVGVNQYSGNAGYNFYPAGWINNVAPQVQLTRTTGEDGDLVLQSVAPGVSVSGGQSSNLALTLYPDDRQLTQVGIQHLRYATLSFSSNPGARFTYLSTTLRYGEDVDYLTGDRGSGPQLSANLQIYPLDRLEMDLSGSYQSLNADKPMSPDSRLFDEIIWQLRTLWFFRSDLYVETSAQTNLIHRNQASYTIPVLSEEKYSLLFLMFAWEPSPRTHFYVGYRRSTAQTAEAFPFDGDQTQFFLKAAYEFTP